MALAAVEEAGVAGVVGLVVVLTEVVAQKWKTKTGRASPGESTSSKPRLFVEGQTRKPDRCGSSQHKSTRNVILMLCYELFCFSAGCLRTHPAVFSFVIRIPDTYDMIGVMERGVRMRMP